MSVDYKTTCMSLCGSQTGLYVSVPFQELFFCELKF